MEQLVHYLLKGLGHVVHIVCHPREDVAAGGAVESAEREAVDFRLYPLPQVIRHVLHRGSSAEAGEPVEHG